MPIFAVPAPTPGGPTPPEGEAPLRSELVAALDHDLRTSLTTVLGALQTLARTALAPDDPDLAALLQAALAQAQKMRRLLDELPAAAAPGDTAHLLPPEVADLIRQAGETGGHAVIIADVPDDLGELHLPAPGLRRALAGILGRAASPAGEVRVVVRRGGGDCRFTITTGDNALPPVSPLSRRLVAAMGGRIEQAEAPDPPSLHLIFPGTVRSGAD